MQTIMNQEYVSIEIDNGPGTLELEAFPYQGDIGPVFFRAHNQYRHNPYAVACKMSEETWEDFWGRIDPDWSLVPAMRELAATLEKEWEKQAS